MGDSLSFVPFFLLQWFLAAVCLLGALLRVVCGVSKPWVGLCDGNSTSIWEALRRSLNKPNLVLSVKRAASSAQMQPTVQQTLFTLVVVV